MTSDQRERLLGKVLLGESEETACQELGLTPGEVLAEQRRDSLFRDGYYAALRMSDWLREHTLT